MSGQTTFTRRRFLKGSLLGLGALLTGAGGYRILRRVTERPIPGEILGASSGVGHLLRDQDLSLPPEREESVEAVIVGGGISGLSAAWWLGKNDCRDFVLLELEAETGGNSSSGQNEISAYPWGAHYLPLPGPEAVWVRDLLEELGVIRGYDTRGLPVYDELYLCSDPHERLFIQGRWQEGLVPQTGITSEDRRDYDGFFGLLEAYKTARGRDGKKAFSIPLEESSRDPKYLGLDQLSMAEFMRSRGWFSEKLHWYVNYCCRDDYGVGHEKVSAWAGLHYFAARTGVGANADAQTVLAWPEGNGWLAKRLREKSEAQIRTGSLVFSVKQEEGGVVVDYLEVVTRKRIRLRAKQVIFAAPRFVAPRVIGELAGKKPSYLEDLRYAPWLVANVSVDSLPQGRGAPLSWDNVSYYGRSLGYVVATHQGLSLFPKRTVLTFYQPLDESEPREARRQMVGASHGQWAARVADELERMHPGIRSSISSIDVWLWGHGMISPGVGFLWGESRRGMQASIGKIHFAHSDMSGVSIFEEAQYQGVLAARKVLGALGRAERRKRS